ncbi:hypothetical protein SAMN05446037_101047 [Anaerovirgula multivorans]|uniref:Lipoprotein n=1 Tax=Anaerovirgula multivorans TaxID=312168 RepID=A0A239EHZ5_9FIRM|nr:hypothetical protein [Anaerovirgula multivorans]SNS44275.1 hypothetical protein SAMN05446037_101047 [Anaerovirgula multivorans]
MKRSKKLISVLLVFLMVTLLITGCSKEEQKLYGLMKEMSSLEASQQNGEISLDINQLPEEFLEEAASQLGFSLEMLQNYSIIYEMKQDTQTMNAELVLSIYDKVNKEQIPFITSMSDGDMVYVKVDDMINFIKTVTKDDLAKEQLTYLFGDAQYISMTNEEIIDFYIELLPASSEAEKQILKNTLSQSLDKESVLKQREEVMSFISPLMGKIAKTYDGFETSLVTEEDNKLILSVGTVEIFDVVKGFVNYSIDHADEVAVLLKEIVPAYLEYTQKQMHQVFVAQGMEEEIEEMDIQMDDIAIEINSKIDEFAEMVNGNEEEYKAMVAMFIDMASEEVKAATGDSALNITLEKIGDATYTTVVDLKVDAEQEQVAFNLNVTETTKSINSFKITKPTQNVMAGDVYFEKIQDIMAEIE